MANLDTTNKRRSGLRVMLPSFGVMIEPVGIDGIAQDDRQHIAMMYGGILATGNGAGPLLGGRLLRGGRLLGGRLIH